jgi:hypothetical protein
VKKEMGFRPAPTLGPDSGAWRHNRVHHLVLVFDSAEQEAAYRRWLADPASYDAFGRWFDEGHCEERLAMRETPRGGHGPDSGYDPDCTRCKGSGTIYQDGHMVRCPECG